MLNKFFSVILILTLAALLNNSIFVHASWYQSLDNNLIAQMTGSNYRIITDSLNSGGTDLSSSSNYVLSDTIGEVGTGVSSSTNFKLSAGYRQMQDSYISISSPADVAMSPNISGVTGGTSNGSATWTVTTDNTAGYTVSVKAETSPAMTAVSGAYFDDYTPSASDPDYTFSILATESAFAFSPEGDDIVSRFRDNGSACGTGVSDTSDRCWDGLDTTDQTIVQGTSSNQPNGTDTTIKFRAESGSSNLQEAATYSATITVTAVTL